MEKYILLTILIAFVIYLFCRKKDLIEGNLGGEGVETLTRELGSDAAAGIEQAAARRVAEDAAENAVLTTSFHGTFLTNGDSSAIRRTFRESKGDMKFTGKFAGKKDSDMLKILKDSNNVDHELAKEQYIEMQRMTALARGDRKLAKKFHEDINFAKNAGKSEEELAIMRGDFEAAQKKGVTGADVEAAGSIEQAYKNNARRIAGKTEEEMGKIERAVSGFVEKNPRLVRYTIGAIGIYGLLRMLEDSAEACQEKCLAGEDEEWLRVHDNYSEFCSDKSSSTCATYCDPNHGESDDEESGQSAEDKANAAGDDAACSPASRMKTQIEQKLLQLTDGAGGAAGGMLDILKDLLMGDLGVFLGAVCGCLCLVIVGYTVFTMVARSAKNKIVGSAVAQTIKGNAIVQGSLQNVKKLDNKLSGGSLNKKYNKYVIIIIFFVFIIYNECRNKK